MPQAELREAMPIRRASSRAHQIAGGLQLGRGHVDRLEQPAGMEARELARVAPVGLDPIARPLRHQARRHHLVGDPPLDPVAIERSKPVGPAS